MVVNGAGVSRAVCFYALLDAIALPALTRGNFVDDVDRSRGVRTIG
jgi:hypothetical protein